MDPVRHVYINGVERECLIGSFDLRETTNRVPIMSGDFVSADASFRPAIDDEILVLEDGDTIFGGVIDSAEESATEAQVAIASITTRVDAIGFSSFADRRYVNATLAAGTLKSQLTTLVAYLTAYGVSLDAGQVDGPSMPELVCEYRKLTDVLNDLSSLSSGSGGSPDAPYLWEIDYAKTLRMFQIGTSAAPVDLIEGAGVEVGDLVVKPTNQSYANRVILRSGGGLVTIVDDAAGQLAHGLREVMIDTQADLSTAVADQAAAGLLTQFSQAQIEARYSTVAQGIKPGQIQTITSAKRNVDASFLITDVSTRQEPNGTALLRSVVALAGYRLQGSWQDVLARWANGSNGVGIPGSGGSGGFGTGSVGGGFGGGGGGGGCCVDGGSLLFSGYGDSPVKMLSPSGLPLTIPNAPQLGEGGCQGICALDDGTFGVTGVTDSTNFLLVRAYTSSLASSQGCTPFNAVTGIARGAAVFYGALTITIPSVDIQLQSYDNTGQILATTSLADATLAQIALGVSRDANLVYYAATGTWDHVNVRNISGVSTATFATETGYKILTTNGILVLGDGTVLVGWSKSGSVGFVRHYAADGSTLHTYSLVDANAAPICLTAAVNDATFWVSFYGAAATYSSVTVQQIMVSNGGVVNDFDPDDGTFEFDGPFCVTRASIEP